MSRGSELYTTHLEQVKFKRNFVKLRERSHA